jgi:hypothetical protein
MPANTTAVPTEPIPLSVLTGFLGSGKTTFLSRVLAVPDLRDTAVVISEFGAVALDHLLLEATADEVVELPNGCTCCARTWPTPFTACSSRARQAAEGRRSGASRLRPAAWPIPGPSSTRSRPTPFSKLPSGSIAS